MKGQHLKLPDLTLSFFLTTDSTDGATAASFEKTDRKYEILIHFRDVLCVEQQNLSQDLLLLHLTLQFFQAFDSTVDEARISKWLTKNVEF